MAPKRKSETAAAAPTTRVTRSSTRLTNAAVAPPAADPKPPKKKAKTTDEEVKTQSPPSPAAAEAAAAKTIVIEHCKQCNSFKTRAFQVRDGLQKSVAGVKVVVNPEKPRRGCFEIREEGGEVFVSLVGMKRPFPPLKKLDMEELISQIVEKIR